MRKHDLIKRGIDVNFGQMGYEKLIHVSSLVVFVKIQNYEKTTYEFVSFASICPFKHGYNNKIIIAYRKGDVFTQYTQEMC